MTYLQWRVSVMRIVLMVAMLWVAAGCGPAVLEGESPTPIPEPEPISVPADPWTRIEQSGRMIVGLSADYRPFEYYNQNFRIDGFDPALIRAIGEELGVEVQLLDIAFEGLPAALTLGQIDVAISAISVTPERRTQLDFSQVYFVSEDALIAPLNSGMEPITNLAQLETFRVGVQEGSLYESLLVRELVETGILAESRLFSYRNFDSVVADLLEGRLDLVMMDLIPAQQLVAGGSVEIVGQGLNSQSYAIAIRPGASVLQAELNRGIEAVRNSGRLAELVAEYLLIEPPDQSALPTPEPLPTATPVPPFAEPEPEDEDAGDEPLAQTTPGAGVVTEDQVTPPDVEPVPETPACVDGMRWLADLNFDDQDMQNPPVLGPGQAFQKGWRIQNTGTCPWGPSYGLNFVQGNVDAARMGGVFRPVIGTVEPGAVYDLYLDLTAPIAPGTYQGIWQMQDSSGAAFGERIWVGIQVPAPATPTPVPTPTPTDQIDFRADRLRINAGERVVFNWQVQDVAAVYFYAQGQRWEDHGVGGVDSREVYPTQSTTYELRVVGRDGATRVLQIRIEVTPVANAPRLTRFTVDPPGNLSVGQCVTVRWETEGAINRVQIRVNDSTTWDYAPVRGQWDHCPPSSGTYVYGLIADGPQGTVRGSDTRVVQGQSPPVQPTPVPPQQSPIIYGFSAQPAHISPGACVTVAWSAGAGTQFVRLLRNGAVILDSGPVSGNIQDCIGQPGLVNYRLEARNNAGGVATGQTGVNVAGQ